jgi:acetyl esterase/lipase
MNTRPQGEKAFHLWTDQLPTTLTPYWPERANERRSAILILPGGGYEGLAPHEGEGYARWFAARGTACFVLNYRLGSQGFHHPAMLEDAARALRLIRYNAKTWDIDPGKIAIIGSSAGGHLTATLLTQFDEGNPKAKDPVDHVSSRPDFGILCYPVITMLEKTHGGSRDNLLGPNPSEELQRKLSAELQVTPQTPPCFIWHTWEDGAVPVENSLNFAAALRRNGVHFDLHIYERGNHGLGLGNGHPWASQCEYWLREQKFF